MFSQLTLVLKNNTTKKITMGISSVFHGALMELVGSDTAAWMHQGQMNSYAQYIQYDEDTIWWYISTTTEESYQKIICPILQSSDSELYLSYHDLSLEIIEKKVSSIKQEVFLQNQYFCDYDRYFTIHFITPASFKSNGKYMNYPTLRWIFQSLMHKHDFAAEKNRIFDGEVLDSLEENCSVSAYKLRSTYFYLEGMKIYSFMGNLTICVKGNQSIVNLVNYLLMFGTYSGVGMKSSIGMGAITVDHRERK